MTRTTPTFDPGQPFDPEQSLDTDAALHRALQHLLSGADQRQVWAFFLDEHQRITDPIMPIEELPEDPHEICDSDLGPLPFARLLSRRLAWVSEEISAPHLALVWERRGSEVFTKADLEWARLFSAAWPRPGVRLRAQFLLHDSGLRQLTPDDYA